MAEGEKKSFINSYFKEGKDEKYEFPNILGGDSIPVHFLEDQTSNGYIDSILKRLKATEFSTQEIRNSDFIEYSIEVEG